MFGCEAARRGRLHKAFRRSRRNALHIVRLRKCHNRDTMPMQLKALQSSICNSTCYRPRQHTPRSVFAPQRTRVHAISGRYRLAAHAASTLERSDMQTAPKGAKDTFAFRDDEDLDRQNSGQEASISSQAQSLSRGAAPKSGQILGLDKGVWVAAGLLTTWATMIHITVFHTPLGSLQSYLLFWPMMQLHTGVFITAHDAMHGAVAPSNPKLNKFMGRLAGTLYAGLDYDSMKEAHHEHHAHTGYLEKDPDFHAGNPSLPSWAGKFIKRYLSIKQMVILNLMVGAVQISGAPYKNMVIFLLCAGLLSAAQLFYFGTYVPHRPPKEDPSKVMIWEESNPTWATTRLASWVTCYHFDCHVEHHSNPRLAWYELWSERKKTLIRESQ